MYTIICRLKHNPDVVVCLVGLYPTRQIALDYINNNPEKFAEFSASPLYIVNEL